MIFGMKTYKECIKEAEENQIAIGHFNIANTEMFWGVINAARARELPIIIGVSEGERDYIGLRQVAALVKSVREEYDHPIFLNADHTYSFERVKEVADAGFDSVVIDGAKLPLEENREMVRKSVEYIRSVNPEMLAECELGYIGSSSSVFDELPEGAAVSKDLLTKPEEAKEFVDSVGVDLLAPAVGSVHGMSRKGLQPKLYTDRIAEIRETAGVPLVLHGGSGSSKEDMREAIKAGISIIHISTELRVAYKEGIKRALSEKPEEVAPYKYLNIAISAVEEVVGEKLDLFSGRKDEVN